jgi:exodeoxyribonuclease VII small subunit
MNFENKLRILEEKVSKMESGESTIDEMIKEFEAGQKLVTDCQKDLEGIRLKIEKVTTNQ